MKNILVLIAILSGSELCMAQVKSVTCEATLKEYTAEHPWHEELNGSYSDGLSPLATFSITPSIGCGNREVKVLFKYKVFAVSQIQLASDIGVTYNISLPADFFEGNANIIANNYVSSLARKTP